MQVLSGVDRYTSTYKKPVVNLENAWLKTTGLLRTFDLLTYIANSRRAFTICFFKMYVKFI